MRRAGRTREDGHGCEASCSRPGSDGGGGGRDHDGAVGGGKFRSAFQLPHRALFRGGDRHLQRLGDYLTMLNERDGGIGGAPIIVEECETGYDTKKGVEMCTL